MNENMIATGGVFDIIHADHINLFETMWSYNKTVVVFLNSDESVIANRGKPPLISQRQRKEVLRSIRWVDAVHYFKEKHPHEIIKRFKPAIWAKGGDYDIEKMQSTPIVRSYGGKVITIPHKYGIHSSDILKEFRQGNPDAYWVWIVYGYYGAGIDELLGAFNTRAAAQELVKDNKEKFPNQSFDYEEMRMNK